ncbi:hypothetical protein WOLCODRAFT_161386 [Wolfiporia cocos MD-104 SS10]|uniref:Uncharacterized protein n=1 Tax=Wolfiporia cocos (strain MD-104) TaxID=742152 RepID=A0A2H3JEI1_WOLCO|nr:hypothetical protein WOLCODRAFT_161386 [Wolfiporia cocos MD-104 SS10]
MSSDVLIDLGPDALSPLSSASEDTDAVDTETARVYFGPLKPSEQKYAAVGAQPTPLRRSARLSSMATPHVGAGDSDAGTSNAPSRDESVSRVGTPIEDVLPSDEPSIILASKILRAHDNPSPPPSPPPEVHVSPRLDALFDVSEAFTSEAVPFTTETPIDPAQMTADVAITQPDLITFDSPSTPSRSVHIAQLRPTERLDAPPPSLLATGATVDDLLSMSPQPPPPAPFMPQAISQSVSGETTDSVDSETQVLEALSGEESAPAEQELLVEVERNADPRTPLRRSTRRRRTSSPARPKLVSVQNDSTLPYASTSTDDDDVAPQLFAPTTPLRFKKKNRKSSRSPSRDIMGDSISYDTENAQPNSTQYIAEAQGVQETHAPETERELRSLSPTSNDVLMQVLFGASEPTEQPPQELIPSSEPASESNAAVPGPALTDSQAAQPIVPASDIQRTPQPILSTPTRALDVSRTPARRVPIAQAIVQGTFSPQKQSSSAASGQTKPSGVGIGTLGSPVFKRSALDDPTRTPAKRVPLKEALAAASTQPQDKGKAPVRHASPALDLSRERTRSGSTEPRPSRRAEKAAAEPTRPFVSALAAARSSKPSLDTASKSRSALTKSYLNKDEPLKTLPFPVVPSRRTPGSTSEADTVRSKLKPSPPEPIVVSSPPSSPAKAGSILKQPSAGASSRIPRIGTKPYARPTPVGPPATEKKPPLVARRAVGKPPTSATSNSGGF